MLVNTQASRVFARFGGVPKLYQALKDAGVERNITAIYKWNLPKDTGGTAGMIPASAWPDVKRAARLAGVALRPEDTCP